MLSGWKISHHLKHSALALVVCAWLSSRVLGLGQDQLYTGDAETVAPGHVQYQLFYNTAFNRQVKLSGSSLTFGATSNAEVKVSYGYLWNDRGPNVQLGPTVGAKWRFVGDGRKKPSVAASVLYAINRGATGTAHKNDIGGLLIVQYPLGYATLLANLGKVWIGDDLPDLRFAAVALAKLVTPRVIVAAQYLTIEQLDKGPRQRDQAQYVLALVYSARYQTGYSVQVGFPTNGSGDPNMTLGFSKYF